MVITTILTLHSIFLGSWVWGFGLKLEGEEGGGARVYDCGGLVKPHNKPEANSMNSARTFETLNH